MKTVRREDGEQVRLLKGDTKGIEITDVKEPRYK